MPRGTPNPDKKPNTGRSRTELSENDDDGDEVLLSNRLHKNNFPAVTLHTM